MERFYWLEPHVTQIKSRDFSLRQFYTVAEGSLAFKSRVPQPIKMRYNSSTTCASHVIIRFSINMSALTSPPPLCDVRRVNPRHFWSFIQGSNTLFYNLRTFWDHCYNVYSLGIKSFKPLSTPGLKGDPGRVTVKQYSLTTGQRAVWRVAK